MSAASQPSGDITRQVVESVPIRVFWKDRAGRYLGCNTLFARDAGVDSPEAILGLTDEHLVWREQAQAYRADDLSVIESEQPKINYVERQTSPDGSLLWLRTSKVPLRDPAGQVVGVLGIYEDVTESKLTETLLRDTEDRYRASERRFQDVFENLPDPVWIIGQDNRFVLCNRAAAATLGYDSPEDLTSRHPGALSPLLQPDGRPSTDKADEMMAVAHERGVHRFDWVHRRRNGEDFPVEVTLAEIISGGERQLYCVWRDISDRKRFEQSLESSNAFLASLIGGAAEGICVSVAIPEPPYMSFSVWNDQMVRITGYSLEEINQRGWLDSLFPDAAERDAARARVDRCRFDDHLVNEEWSITTRSGGRRTVAVSTSRLDLPDGVPALIGLIRDVTELQQAQDERARLEAQLHDAQRLEAVGRLAGGVAHDFNNMLTVILGSAEMGLEEVPPDHPVHACLKEIQDAATRSADLTRQLLAFASRQTTMPVVLDLNTKIAGTLRMLRRIIGENIRLIWSPGERVSPVLVDPSQVDQVLANLCVNARDAIDGVGTIRIATSRVQISDEYVARHPGATAGEHALLMFSDDGCGMPADVLEHIFEPFFTTKGVGKGTGLGLATVYGIVRQNGGHIDVTSHQGVGTTFRVYLPAHVAEGELETAAAQATGPVGGSETVLLVEDEPGVRRMTRQMLERLGYHVLVAPSAAAAMALVSTHTGPLDLLLTDVIMPDMNGRDLCRRLRMDRPTLPAVFVSGYPSDAITIGDELDARTHFIAKPFTLDRLAATVRSALVRTPE